MNRWVFGNHSLLTGFNVGRLDDGSPFGILEIRERYHMDQGDSSWQDLSPSKKRVHAAGATERAVQARTENVHFGFHSSEDVKALRRSLGRLERVMREEEAAFAAEQAKEQPDPLPANWEEVKKGKEQ